jgi:cob(I)alamin adenosyltransferase
MKLYTKGGDKGMTSLLGGARVKKYETRIEAYGTVDELNAQIGVVRSCEITESDQKFLIAIQNALFTMGSKLATEPGNDKVNIPELHDEDITALENEIDKIDATLPPMRNFVLPGGNMAVAHSHVARCVCRRAERAVLSLSENEDVPPIIVIYLNRLSDYLFILSRKLSHETEAEEIPWIPNNR